MKYIYIFIALLAILVSSCQQDAIIEDTNLTTRSISSNAFTFDVSYMSWNNQSYMLDYGLIGSSDIPLDKPIYIWCKIVYTNGYVNPTIFITIPAGISSYSSEGSTLGENLAAMDGMAGASIESVTYAGYAYNGSMEIIGLDDLTY